MKTFDTTTTGNTTHSRDRVRFVLTLTGIVTALLCAVALLQDARSSERINASMPQLLESYKMVGADLIGEVKAWI